MGKSGKLSRAGMRTGRLPALRRVTADCALLLFNIVLILFLRFWPVALWELIRLSNFAPCLARKSRTLGSCSSRSKLTEIAASHGMSLAALIVLGVIVLGVLLIVSLT